MSSNSSILFARISLLYLLTLYFIPLILLTDIGSRPRARHVGRGDDARVNLIAVCLFCPLLNISNIFGSLAITTKNSW